MRGVSGGDPEDGARSGGPRQRFATVRRGGSAPRSPATTTGVRGVRWDRSGRKSGEGKARARPKIATVERREASVSERRGRLTRALGVPQGTLRGCRSTRTLSRRSATPHFGCAKQKSKTRAQKRAAGTKKRVLFDK